MRQRQRRYHFSSLLSLRLRTSTCCLLSPPSSPQLCNAAVCCVQLLHLFMAAGRNGYSGTYLFFFFFPIFRSFLFCLLFNLLSLVVYLCSFVLSTILSHSPSELQAISQQAIVHSTPELTLSIAAAPRFAKTMAVQSDNRQNRSAKHIFFFSVVVVFVCQLPQILHRE